MDGKILSVLSDLESLCKENNWFWIIPRESGEFIRKIILSNECKRGLEIGSFKGYSSIWIASALYEKGGTLVSIEIDKKNALDTIANCEKAGLDNVSVVCGNALDVIPDLTGKFDFVFIDAKKEDYSRYLELLENKLGSNFVIIADNVISHKDKLANFFSFVEKKFDLEIENIGKGLAILKIKN